MRPDKTWYNYEEVQPFCGQAVMMRTVRYTVGRASKDGECHWFDTIKREDSRTEWCLIDENKLKAKEALEQASRDEKHSFDIEKDIDTQKLTNALFNDD